MFATPLIMPPLTCTAQGNVCPVRISDHAPAVSVVVVAGVVGLPPAQLIVIVPDSMGAPTAAVPLRLELLVVVPPPHPAKTPAMKAAISDNFLKAFIACVLCVT